jgi:hypothetical protein
LILSAAVSAERLCWSFSGQFFCSAGAVLPSLSGLTIVMASSMGGKTPIKPNEQSAIGPIQMQSTWSTLSKHVQLMPQHQDLGLKPPS